MEVKRTDYCIKRAVKEDIGDIDRLLRQVLEVHHNGRPDLFKTDTKKYTPQGWEHLQNGILILKGKGRYILISSHMWKFRQWILKCLKTQKLTARHFL